MEPTEATPVTDEREESTSARPAVTAAASRAEWSIVALGLALRALPWIANRSLWADEAALALNVTRRSFAGLVKPLDFDQGAPIGFLWIEKLATLAFGPGERALRLVPLLA